MIPKVVKVIFSKRAGKSREINVPKKCPVCGEKIVKEKEDEVYWYCVNPDCPARIKESILHFASRSAMDIEGVGESLVDELINRGLAKSLVDIYKLDVNDFLKLPLFKEKKAKNIYDAIQKSKSNSLKRFLYGLGIRHIGEKIAGILADKYPGIDIFFKLKKEDYTSIPDIGDVMAESLVNFFGSRRVKKMIDDFKKVGLSLEDKKEKFSNTLEGKVFVFTGELEGFSRSQAREIVEGLGGRWSSSLSKNTNFLVAGRNPGSKMDKAEKLGVSIIDESEFKKIIARR